MAKFDYNSSNFRNGAIDRLKDRFGKGQTEKAVVVRPSAEQMAKAKDRMDSEINRMDAETHGYERGSDAISAGWARGQEGMERHRKLTQDTFFENHAAPFKGKDMKTTRSVYQASKKANQYAKDEYNKNYNKAPMEEIPTKSLYDREIRIKKGKR